MKCGTKVALLIIFQATGLTWFGFLKAKLCPISHNDLIMEWFSSANLYDLPLVTVSSFSSEIDRKETTVYVIAITFYDTPILCLERELWMFSHDHLFEMKFRSLKNHYLPQIICSKILQTKIWNFYTTFIRISASLCKNFSFMEKKL